MFLYRSLDYYLTNNLIAITSAINSAGVLIILILPCKATKISRLNILIHGAKGWVEEVCFKS